jgi:hypothetical protein
MPILRLSQISGFQNFEADCFGDGLGHEHRFGVAEEVEVSVSFEDAMQLREELLESVIREDREPVVTRRLAALQARCCADRAMFLERLVRRIGDGQIDRA